MKKLLLFTLILSIIVLSSCSGNNKLEKADTNLEFWIGQNVDGFDFSGYHEKYGIMGGREFYGKNYTPGVDAQGNQTAPDKYVLYTVTSYPDYSSKAQHITSIYITDPEIKFYGISLKSTAEEFDRLIKEQGFEIAEKADKKIHSANKGDYSVLFASSWIRISVNVTNKEGIVF